MNTSPDQGINPFPKSSSEDYFMNQPVKGEFYTPSTIEIPEGFHFNPFDHIDSLCRLLNPPKSKYALGWRLVEAEVGQINGLPESHGLLVATDGMLCIIMVNQTDCYIGHNEWWQSEDRDEPGVRKFLVKKKSGVSASEIDVILEA